MARKVYRMDVLSISSIENLKKQLENYQKVEIPNKTQEFVSKLADLGITVARSNTGVLDDIGNVSSLVSFTKQVNKIENWI